MKSKDAAVFDEQLLVIMNMYGKPEPTQAVKRAWWGVLLDFDIETVTQAFKQHMATSKFPPKPADIIEIVLTSDGRPSADEAWSIAQTGFSESLTVVWTSEISTAFLASALPLARDLVGARMAFRDHYNRLVDQARQQRQPAKWVISRGHDVKQANEVIQDAAERGLLTQEQAAFNLRLEGPTGDGAVIQNLIAHKVHPGDIGDHESSEKNKHHIAELRAILAGNGASHA